jgi:hypothetical protein
MATEQNTMSVECPYCNERFAVVQEQSEQTHDQQSGEHEEPMNAELLSYEEIEGSQPYSGRDEEIPVEQCVQAKIDIDGKTRKFTFWYTPERDGYKYIVRGNLDSGSKMKTVYDGRNYAFYTDRGVPRNSDKKWTYLDEEECRRRANIAGLGEVRQSAEDPNRNQILIDELEDGLTGNEDLLLKLAKGLTVFQTADY